ncbi:transposase [Neorhizobium vignae]|uniref:transposase n=1 Tax=Neorhizobium vignae TaxID=690585 RepID=UPI000A0248A6
MLNQVSIWPCQSNSRSKALLAQITRRRQLVIGTADRRKIAALAGLAPIARDSGQSQAGHWRRRATIRTALYLAALHASRQPSVTFGIGCKMQETS